MGDKMAVLCNQVGYLPQGRKTAVLTEGEYFKIIQAEPGQDEEGGVYHKLTSERHADFIMPEEDHAPFYLFPVSSMATADHAACYSLNEITIYWNTPAVFVAAYFNGK